MPGNKDNLQSGRVVIYRGPRNEVEVEARFEKGEIWLSQAEIARLYKKERSVVTKHINNIFRDKEVDKKSNVRKLHIAGSDRPVAFYSLDVILAVGYRTSSARAIHFRKWATRILKDYLISGYAINQKRILETRARFEDLQNAINFLKKKSRHKLLSGQGREILDLLADYSKALRLLEEYDKHRIRLSRKTRIKFILKYEEAKEVIRAVKKDLTRRGKASNLFGRETDSKLKAILGNIYQTFKGKEVYPSLEEKAAHLLYFIVKDHPFIDGNKRIGSFLFVYFLDRNDFLYKETGERKINDNALTALTLLIAVSAPKDRDILIKIITNLISR